ncbi:MAG: MFS transporter [Elusimicrobiota bacterium]|nr:MFS transporter [Elusimicrobiota bacterium]
MVNPNTVLLITVLASFSTPFMLSSINIALPAMAPELGLDAMAMGWVSLSFLLASASLLVPMGRAADIFGRKKIFTLGFVIFTAASLFCGLAASQGQLLAARVLQGVGSSMIFGTSVAILTSVFPPEKRGKAIGWVAAAVSIRGSPSGRRSEGCWCSTCPGGRSSSSTYR